MTITDKNINIFKNNASIAKEELLIAYADFVHVLKNSDIDEEIYKDVKNFCEKFSGKLKLDNVAFLCANYQNYDALCALQDIYPQQDYKQQWKRLINFL